MKAKVRALVFGVSVISASFCLHSRTEAQGLGVGVGIGVGAGFGQWNQAITAYGDYLRWLGEARLNSAQASYVEALAAQEMVRANALAKKVRLLELDTRRVNSKINQLSKLETKIFRFGRTLDSLLEGNVTPEVLGAVRFFIRLLPPETLSELVSSGPSAVDANSVVTTPFIAPALRASDFELLNATRQRWNSETSTMETYTVQLSDFSGGNLFQFLAWLKSHRMVAKGGSLGHLTLVDLRNRLAAGGGLFAQRISEERKAQETNSRSIWESSFGGEFALPDRESL